MKRNQLKGIFTELIETSTRKSAFTSFIQTEDISSDVTLEKSEIGLKRKRIFEELQKLKADYVDIIEDPKTLQIFARLARLETAIVQHRSMLDTEVKLTLLNQKRGGSETSYIVARAPFFNPNNVKAEIRAYLGKAEDLGTDLVKLSNDLEFMKMAEFALVSSMEEYMIIQDTLPVKKKEKTMSAVKAPVMLEVVANQDLEEQFEISDSKKKSIKSMRRNPYQPGPGPNPRPSGLILSDDQKD
jgi:hypothetical protein